MAPSLGRDVPVLDLKLRSGDRWIYRWRITDKGDHNLDGVIEDPGNPLPRNVSGFTFTAQIRASKDSGTALTSVAIDDTAAGTGLLVLKLTPTQTRALYPPGSTVGKKGPIYVWDLQAESKVNAEDTETWVEGTVTIDLDVTRP